MMATTFIALLNGFRNDEGSSGLSEHCVWKTENGEGDMTW